MYFLLYTIFKIEKPIHLGSKYSGPNNLNRAFIYGLEPKIQFHNKTKLGFLSYLYNQKPQTLYRGSGDAQRSSLPFPILSGWFLSGLDRIKSFMKAGAFFFPVDSFVLYEMIFVGFWFCSSISTRWLGELSLRNQMNTRRFIV